MEISYSFTKDFTSKELEDLFLSVDWKSGNYPDELKTAMKNSHKVLSAWDGNKLVGLINCLSDGAMAAYFHYLLVRPEYQSMGIGRKLMCDMLSEYKDCKVKVLIAYYKAIEFYINCGFKAEEDTIPMFLTDIQLT